MNLPDHWPLAAYRFDLQCEQGGWLPPWPGSALRGAFGIELRNLACMTGASDCNGCLLRHSCLYSSVFESPRVPTRIPGNGREGPNPYVMTGQYQEGGQHIRTGQSWSFTMVVMGPALRHLPLLVLCWKNALSRGLTNRDLRFSLTAVTCLDTLDGNPQTVWNKEKGDKVEQHQAGVRIPPAPQAPSLALSLQTPTRILRQRELQKPDNFEFANWLAALIRRYAAVAECHLELPESQWPLSELAGYAAGINCAHDLHWRNWERYSNRQQQKMALGGLMGTFRLQGDWQPLWPLLYLGQWLHVGKNATFGLGGYRIRPQAASESQ